MFRVAIITTFLLLTLAGCQFFDPGWHAANEAKARQAEATCAAMGMKERHSSGILWKRLDTFTCVPKQN